MFRYVGAYARVPCRESGLEDSAFLSWDPLYTDPAPVEFSHSLMKVFLSYALRCIYPSLLVYRHTSFYCSSDGTCTINAHINPLGYVRVYFTDSTVYVQRKQLEIKTEKSLGNCENFSQISGRNLQSQWSVRVEGMISSKRLDSLETHSNKLRLERWPIRFRAGKAHALFRPIKLKSNTTMKVFHESWQLMRHT